MYNGNFLVYYIPHILIVITINLDSARWVTTEPWEIMLFIRITIGHDGRYRVKLISYLVKYGP